METTRKLAAVMFTDIAGYTALMGNDEAKAFEFLRINRQLHKPVIERYHGRWIKELGDGVLASFDTVSDAVYAAMEIQEACNQHHAYALRIGIHQGEVVFEGDDVFGDTVNIAARIQALAPVGGIWISEAVHYNVSNKPNIETRFVKSERLKNVKAPVNLYEVVLSTAAPAIAYPAYVATGASGARGMRRSDKKRTVLYTSAGVALLLLLFAIGFMLSEDKAEAAKSQATSEAVSTSEKIADKSIAVLPFVNMSSDKDQEYFSDGLSEELLNHLSKISDLKVIARTSSFAFKGKNVDVRTISEKLGVAHILEGSVRKDGSKIRVRAQLIRASDGAHLWSETFDRDMEGVFKLQDEIAAAVVHQLKLKLLPNEVLVTSETNTDAYNLILQGRYFNDKLDKENVAKALDYYMQALAIDSLNATAWAMVAGAYSRQAWQNYMDQDVGYNKARQAALRAIELDSKLALGHLRLGGVKMYHDFDWEGADAAFQKAQSLQPGSPDMLIARGSLAGILGNWNEAIQLTEQSLVLDPLKPLAYMDQGNHFTHSGQTREGMRYFQKALEINPHFQRLHMYLGRGYLLEGEPKKALVEMQQEPSENFRTFGLALAYHALGREQKLMLRCNNSSGATIKTGLILLPSCMLSGVKRIKRSSGSKRRMRKKTAGLSG